VIEVKCPRCEQYWYTDERGGGTVRLCSDCAAKLRRGRRAPLERSDYFFLWAVAIVLPFAVLLITLMALWPGVFGVPGLVIGAVMFLVGAGGLRLTMKGGHVAEEDWSLLRWPVLLILAGLACALAYVPFVARAKREPAPAGQKSERVTLLSAAARAQEAAS
jgi:hypothetical protein